MPSSFISVPLHKTIGNKNYVTVYAFKSNEPREIDELKNLIEQSGFYGVTNEDKKGSSETPESFAFLKRHGIFINNYVLNGNLVAAKNMFEQNSEESWSLIERTFAEKGEILNPNWNQFSHYKHISYTSSAYAIPAQQRFNNKGRLIEAFHYPTSGKSTGTAQPFLVIFTNDIRNDLIHGTFGKPEDSFLTQVCDPYKDAEAHQTIPVREIAASEEYPALTFL